MWRFFNRITIYSFLTYLYLNVACAALSLVLSCCITNILCLVSGASIRHEAPFNCINIYSLHYCTCIVYSTYVGCNKFSCPAVSQRKSPQVVPRRMNRVKIIQSHIPSNYRVIELSNPPVNALSHSVRVSLMEQMDSAEKDPSVKFIIITGKGKPFSAGADINEFDLASMREPFLPDVLDRH